MTYNATIALDNIPEGAGGKAAIANALLSAMSSAALWGIKTSVTSGLQFGLYGGNISIAGVPTAIASQTVTLTASAINYIYATSAGVVTKTTSAPTGWPGPISSPAGATALYKLDVGTATINAASANTVCYVLGLNASGPAGATGATGPAGTDLAATRKRLWTANGGGSTTASFFGWETLTGLSLTARTLASTSLRESIPYGAQVSAGTAGSSTQVHSPRTFCYLGNAAGRGGFTWSLRFCLESASSPATARSYFGLFVPATIGNVEPDTLTNLIGIGALASDANFRIFNNDASGTATKTAFATPGNFPARGTDNVYELTLTSVANSGTVSLTLTCINSGNAESAVISSDLPANTVFLAPVMWVNNGSTASAVAMGLMQMVGETRY